MKCEVRFGILVFRFGLDSENFYFFGGLGFVREYILLVFICGFRVFRYLFSRKEVFRDDRGLKEVKKSRGVVVSFFVVFRRVGRV